MKHFGLLGSALGVLLAGCSLLSGQLVNDARDYNDAIENTIDELMIVNILRARDRAPMHFADVPLIHESLQLTAGVTPTFLFGPLQKSTTRESGAVQANAQITPSFDLDNLDTKDFVTGMASAIDPKYVKYWLDKGIDKRLIMLLFFASAEFTEKNAAGSRQRIIVMNSPRSTIDNSAFNDPGSTMIKNLPSSCKMDPKHPLIPKDNFGMYLSMLNGIKTFTTNTYTERKVLSSKFDVNIGANLRQIGTLDPTKLQLVPLTKGGSGPYELFSRSGEEKLALCYTRVYPHLAAKVESAGADTPDAEKGCNQELVTSTRDESKDPPPIPTLVDPSQAQDYCRIFQDFLDGNPNVSLRLSLRSVGEMFQYLGDVVYYEENLATHPQPGRNQNLTLGYCDPARSLENCDSNSGGFLFRLMHEADPAINARLMITYRGERYYLASDSLNDHSLQVIAILNQLVNLNKSASSLNVTPYVQALP